VRIGHFEPAFGLEPVLDTHGTLLQTLAMRNIGFKTDWGIGYRGLLGNYDYEIAGQLGSGMSIYRRDDSFLATARIGTPSQGNFQYGFSLLYGQVLQAAGMRTFPRDELLSQDAMLKKRIGIDGQYSFGPYVMKAEVAGGKDDDKEVLGYLYEIDYTLPRIPNCELELQFQSWRHDLEMSHSDDSTVILGVSYKLNPNMTLRAAFMHDINMMEGDEDEAFLLQFYFYGR
jgi:hypothetical protein